MLWTGVEPVSAAWEAAIITVRPIEEGEHVSISSVIRLILTTKAVFHNDTTLQFSQYMYLHEGDQKRERTRIVPSLFVDFFLHDIESFVLA